MRAILKRCSKCGKDYLIEHQSPDCPHKRFVDLEEEMKGFIAKHWCPNCYCISDVELYALEGMRVMVECPICQAAHIWKTRLKRHPEMMRIENATDKGGEG